MYPSPSSHPPPLSHPLPFLVLSGVEYGCRCTRPLPLTHPHSLTHSHFSSSQALSMGADVNHHRVLDGATALMVAAMHRNVSIHKHPPPTPPTPPHIQTHPQIYPDITSNTAPSHNNIKHVLFCNTQFTIHFIHLIVLYLTIYLLYYLLYHLHHFT